MFWSLSSSCFRFLWFRKLDCPHSCHRAAVLRSWKKLTIKDFTLKKLNLINSSSYYNWLFINVTLNPAVEQLHVGQPKQRCLWVILWKWDLFTLSSAFYTDILNICVCIYLYRQYFNILKHISFEAMEAFHFAILFCTMKKHLNILRRSVSDPHWGKEYIEYIENIEHSPDGCRLECVCFLFYQCFIWRSIQQPGVRTITTSDTET